MPAPAAKGVDLVADIGLQLGVGLPGAAHQAAGIVDAFFETVVPDPVGRFLELPRRFSLVAAHFARHPVELLLELVDLRFQLILPLRNLVRLLRSTAAALRVRHRLLRQLLVLARDLLCLLLHAFHVALSA